MKSNTARLYARLIERFVGWAETCQDIRAAIIVGSRARVDHPADEWADLDLVVITTDPKRYLSTTDWLGNIGSYLLTFVEPTGTGEEMERRVLFDGVLDVDFSMIPQERALELRQAEITPQSASMIYDTFGRGVRVLLDKDGMAKELQKLIRRTKARTVSPPTQLEFLEVVNDFLYHAIFTAKHLRRGELWWSKMCSDCYMQRLLLRMIEWYAHVTHGWNYDTWFRGRFLEKWAGPDILEGLRGAFAHYDEADVRRGLLASMELFRKIAMETARKLNYPYPTHADKKVTEWIRMCLAAKD